MNSKGNSSFIILGDLHLGVRNASSILANYQLDFFETQLFPYMEKNGIDTILQLGDMFDSRKFSSHLILHMWKKRFFEVLESKGYKLIILVGNHDIPMRNSIKINSPNLLLASSYSNVTVIDQPSHVDIKGIEFLIIPWICDENREEVYKMVESSPSIYCAGHFEFSGFEMQKGVVGSGGESTAEFSKFDLVLSGHYHTKSMKGNILYTGVPYEMTWADFNDTKGFHEFNTNTHKLKFIKNTSSLFHKLEYDDSTSSPIPPSNLKGNYIKVVVINKTDPYKFEKFITNIVSQDIADLKITDIEIDLDDVELDNLELEDTKTLMTTFVSQVETDLDKTKIKNLLHSLYLQALEITD